MAHDVGHRRVDGLRRRTEWADRRLGDVHGDATPQLRVSAKGFIEAIVVAATQRRSGIGRMLIERVLADASVARCHKVQLLAHKRHAFDGAHDFYRSLGFEAEAEGFRLYLP